MAARRKGRRKGGRPRSKKRRSARARHRSNPGIVSQNPKRRSARRRSYRRNPLALSGLPRPVRTLVKGAGNAALVVGGEMATNVVASFIPAFLTEPNADGSLKVETPLGAKLRRIAGAGIVGFVADLAGLPSSWTDMLVAGALSAPLRAQIRPMLPTDTKNPLSRALSGDSRMVISPMGSYPMLNAYPAGRRVVVAPGAPPARAGVGGYRRSGGTFGYTL